MHDLGGAWYTRAMPKAPPRSATKLYPNRVTVDFHPEVHAAIERLAGYMGVRKVDVIRMAMKQYVTVHQVVPEGAHGQ